MEDFGPAMDQAELCRIAQVRPGNRGRGISKRVGAVPHGLVFESEVFMLNVHVVDAERLAAVIKRATARPIGIGERIPLRKEIPLLVDRTESFIPHLMVDNDKLAEVRAGPVLNDRLPSTPHFGGLAGSDRIEIARPFRLDYKGAKRA